MRKDSDKAGGNRLQILFYAILVLFVLCVYWIDNSAGRKSSSSASASPSPTEARRTADPEATPYMPFFSVEGLCGSMEREGFEILSKSNGIVSVRDRKTGKRIRLNVRIREDEISSVACALPCSSGGGRTEEFAAFAESQEKGIREEEAEMFGRALTGIISAIDPYVGGNAVPMLSEWNMNILKIRETRKAYHGKVKGLELSALHSDDDGGVLHIVFDLV